MVPPVIADDPSASSAAAIAATSEHPPWWHGSSELIALPRAGERPKSTPPFVVAPKYALPEGETYSDANIGVDEPLPVLKPFA
jgi:hypothetical protein